MKDGGKLLLKKIDDLVEKKESFSFESTLSGLNYIRRIKYWQDQGYMVIFDNSGEIPIVLEESK
jgi:predicted ABC-type ATPase